MKTERNDRIRHENRKDDIGENIITALQYYFQPKTFHFQPIKPVKRTVSRRGVQFENKRVCFLVLKWKLMV